MNLFVMEVTFQRFEKIFLSPLVVVVLYIGSCCFVCWWLLFCVLVVDVLCFGGCCFVF